jgi:hypothetical protein
MLKTAPRPQAGFFIVQNLKRNPMRNPKSNKFAIREADFKLFVVLWNQRMGKSTPDIHLRMARWLEDCWRSGKKNLLLMAFRSSGKSTIAGLFAAWLLYRNPDLRILVLAADLTLAKKMVRNVKRIIERHPLTKNMKPERADQWASDRFTVKRKLVQRDPSMMAKGVSANITGSRADIVICDDVEVPNTSDTAEKRVDLRQRLAEISYVIGDGQGTQLYIGTPHTYYTVYATKPRAEIGEDHAFLEEFERMEIPLLDENGECAWPEKYGEESIALIKRQSGPNKFASQMQLKPVNIAEGRLNPRQLIFYDHDIDYAKELQTLFIGSKKLVGASAFWDPSYGSEKGDRSVFAAVYADEEGKMYLHKLAYIKTDENDELDAATQQCRQVAEMARDLMLPSLAVEGNGIGKFLPGILRNELARIHAPCSVREVTHRRSKDIRILDAFDTLLAARLLYASRAVLRTPFMMEMQEWRPGLSRGHDDGLDAVAGALAQQPVRIERLYGSGAQEWMRGIKDQAAKTEFTI